MDDRVIERALEHGFPAPKDSVREDVLKRCLNELDADQERECTDDELDLLAAAGDPFQTPPK